MKLFNVRNFIMLALALFALTSYAFGLQIADPSDVPALFGMAAAMPLMQGWGRIREPMKPFSNVAVSTTANSTIPRYPRTVLGLLLQLGGTTFAKSDITRIELFLGEKSIWGPVSGTEVNDIVNYVNGNRDQDANWLPVDFTLPNVKEIGGEQIGGIDLSTLPDGIVRVEVDIGSSASAPTLLGHIVWGTPQGGGAAGGMMLKLIKRVYPQLASGDQFPSVTLKNALVLRQFFRYTVANAAVSAAAGGGASFANTGNGVMGAITVSANTRTGRYRLKIVEPAANAGTFVVYDPDGREIGAGNVAAAFSGGGLAFTLADGATDFVSGDGFTIDVLPMNTDGNLNLVEIKRNEVVVWSRTCRAARYEQLRYGRFPQHRMYVADFALDNHIDGLLDTTQPGTTALDYKVNLTSADTLSIVHQMLQPAIS